MRFSSKWKVTCRHQDSFSDLFAAATPEQRAALDAYLDHASDCVAWQFAENNDMLPEFFVIPPPADDFQRAGISWFLATYVAEEFNKALPKLRFDPRADELHAVELLKAGTEH
jgi:hypothetical protein